MEWSHAIQDDEFMFGIEGDWEEADKEPVFDPLQDVDLDSDPIIVSDSIEASPMRHSISMPVAIASFSSTLSCDVSNEAHIHSLPDTFENVPQFGEHLTPSWIVPDLQYSSYGSSTEAEPFLNIFDSDLPVYSTDSPHPEIGSPPANIQRYLEIASIVPSALSNASFDLTHDDEFEAAVERFHIPSNRPPDSRFISIPHRQPTHRSKRSSPGPGIGKKSSPRGRKGPLRSDDRLTTSEVRKVGACEACRYRKTKCDKGSPCRACINYFKGDLVQHPCRGVHLDHVADRILLCGNIFPKDHGLFGTCLEKNGSIFTVHLEVGFGKAWEWPAALLVTQHGNIFPTELRHSHAVYMMRVSTTTGQNEKVERVRQDHWIFPAMLMDTGHLVAALDKHIESLLDDRVSFQSFPLYRSPLQVLKAIYPYYKQNLFDPKHKQLLRQALKLLITVHICGDIKISPNEASQTIINEYFPRVHHSRITPCFIRSQLGPVFKEIASKLMKEVLTTLELHCFDKTCAHFPLVICTFAVLFMSVESIHYHAARDPYHIDHTIHDDDNTTTSTKAATPESFEKSTGVEELLSFYRACFSKYHSERFSNSAQTPSGPVPVVEKLRQAVEKAKTYLKSRGRESVDREGDVDIFFDRLLAKLFLLQEVR